MIGKLLRYFYRVGEVYRVPFGRYKGAKLVYYSDIQMHMMTGLYDRDVMKWLESALTVLNQPLKETAICDIGANNGVYALWMCKFARGCQVFAFEPIPNMAQRIREIKGLNHLEQLNVVELAIADSRGSIEFELRGVAGTASSIRGVIPERTQVDQILKVSKLSLDEFFASTSVPAPSFMKIDVEGALPELLSGGEAILKKYRPIMYVELHSPREDSSLGQFMVKENYEGIRFQDRKWIVNKTATYPVKEGVWGHVLVVPQEHRARLEGQIDKISK